MQKQQTEFEQLQSQLEASVQDKVSLHAAGTVTWVGGCVHVHVCVSVCVPAVTTLCGLEHAESVSCVRMCMYKCLCVCVQV